MLRIVKEYAYPARDAVQACPSSRGGMSVASVDH
jgi:hypothetical protein